MSKHNLNCILEVLNSQPVSKRNKEVIMSMVRDMEYSFMTNPFTDKTQIKFDSIGKVYIYDNVVSGKNILTQDMVSKPDTIYRIESDFDLDGKTITLPKNVTLDFYGGSITNGHIICDNTTIHGLSHNWKDYIKGTIDGTFSEGQMCYSEGQFYFWNGTEWINMKKDSGEKPPIIVTPSAIDYKAEGETKTIKVETADQSTNWTAN